MDDENNKTTQNESTSPALRASEADGLTEDPVPVPKNDISQQFAGIPMGLLICQPILEAAKGQLALCQVYIETLLTLAYVNPSDPSKGCRTLPFTFDRLIIDKVTGKESFKTMTVNAPLISLVPLPAFTMDELTVDFSMQVSETTVDTSNQSTSVTTTESMNFWGINSSITGSVSSDRSHTRNTDNSAKYEIHARAVQQPPSEGMAKLTALFAESIQPIEKKQSGQ